MRQEWILDPWCRRLHATLSLLTMESEAGAIDELDGLVAKIWWEYNGRQILFAIFNNNA